MFDDRIGNLQKMLARMGPEGRQKYATDHADDPIAVSMALFVNNIAKEIKEGKRGEPDMPPPVVQQAIQSMTQPKMPQGGPPQQGPPQGMPPQGMPPQGMPQQGPPPQGMPQQGPPPQGMPPQGMPLQGPPQGMPPPQGQPRMAADGGYMDSRLPEEMGIGALPERSLSNMADGGIIGYADTGLVTDLPGGAIERARRAILEKRAVEERLTPRRGYMTPPAIYDQDTQNAYQQPQETSANVAQQTALPPTLPPAAPAAPPPAAAAPRPAAAAARPTAPPAAANAGAGAGLASLAAQYDNINTAGMSRADILAARDQFEKGITAIDPLKTQREELNAKRKGFAQDTADELEKEIKDRPDPYAKREERANKQEASIAESTERNPYLSLMEAGFAMMAGDSPYAMVNLGKGALAGTKTYRDGLALIEKAKEKLGETRDKIEDYRANRDDLNARERRAAKADIRNTEIKGDESLLAGAALASGNKREDVNKAFEAYQTSHNNEVSRRAQVDTAKINALGDMQKADADRSSREKIAANALSALPPEARLAKLLGNGDLETGLRKLQEISADKSGAVYAQMFAKEVADARKELREPPSAEEYAKSIRSFLSVFKPTVVDDSKVKGSPTVYPRPSP